MDRLPGNSLGFARIHNKLGIKNTFYFRSVHQSFDPQIIEEIVRMGHEIGYHYKDLSLATQRLNAEGGRRKARRSDLETKRRREINS